MARSVISTAQDTNAVLRDVVRLFQQAQRVQTSCCSDATAKECEALMVLARGEAMTVQAFAQQMSLEKTWASRLVTRLEALRFVRRKDNPNDGRSTLIELTAAGKAEQHRLEETLTEHSVNLLRCVPANQRAGIEAALIQLRDALSKCVAECGPETPSDA